MNEPRTHVACAVLHTDAEGNTVPCPGYPHADDTPLAEQLAAALPPFSGDETECSKCGYSQAGTTYRTQGEPRPGTREAQMRNLVGARSNAPERLERCCLRCDYTWDEALAQPQSEQPADTEAP